MQICIALHPSGGNKDLVTNIKRISINSEHSFSFVFIMLSLSFPHHFSSAVQSIIGKFFVVVDLCLIFMSPGIKFSVQYLKEFRYVKHNAKRKIKRHMVFEFVEISTSIYISLKPACIVFCLIYKQKFAFDMRNIPSLYLSCRTTQGT